MFRSVRSDVFFFSLREKRVVKSVSSLLQESKKPIDSNLDVRVSPGNIGKQRIPIRSFTAPLGIFLKSVINQILEFWNCSS
jgi:hypothetical protein